MSPTPAKDGADVHARPRIEGEREQEILDATLDILAEVGYDRLTMDAVAARSKASQATLYRRWNGKPALVIDALISEKEPLTLPDRSEEHTSELQSQMRISYAVFCLKKKTNVHNTYTPAHKLHNIM